MAKVNLMAGIQTISGKAGNFVFRTFRRPDGKTETRMYPYKKHERTTKLRKTELAARSLFTRRQALVMELFKTGQCRSKAEAWKIAKEQIPNDAQ